MNIGEFNINILLNAIFKTKCYQFKVHFSLVVLRFCNSNMFTVWKVNFQAVLPLVFMTLPMIGVIILVISPFELNIGAYGTLIVSILYWQPCIYPLLSLYFVRPLRDELRRKTRRTKVTFVSSKSQLVRWVEIL